MTVTIDEQEFDAAFLDEVERYTAWLELARKLEKQPSAWLVDLT